MGLTSSGAEMPSVEAASGLVAVVDAILRFEFSKLHTYLKRFRTHLCDPAMAIKTACRAILVLPVLAMLSLCVLYWQAPRVAAYLPQWPSPVDWLLDAPAAPHFDRAVRVLAVDNRIAAAEPDSVPAVLARLTPSQQLGQYVHPCPLALVRGPRTL